MNTSYFYDKNGSGTCVLSEQQAIFYGHKLSELVPATEEQVRFHLQFMRELFCNEEGGADGLGLSHLFDGGRAADSNR